MNDQSLERANAFLAAVASRVAVGDVLDETPAELGRELDLPDPLSTARAVRALIARRRLEPAEGSYRLLDARPLEPGERESVGRRPRRKAVPREASSAAAGGTEAVSYADLGRAAVDKLIELGRENADLRAEVRQLREETREARAGRDEADRRARSLAERTRELESRAEMAESNLRALLATARTTQGASKSDAPVADAEMAAILGVLRTEPDQPEASGASPDLDATAAPAAP